MKASEAKELTEKHLTARKYLEEEVYSRIKEFAEDGHYSVCILMPKLEDTDFSRLSKSSCEIVISELIKKGYEAEIKISGQYDQHQRLTILWKDNESKCSKSNDR